MDELKNKFTYINNILSDDERILIFNYAKLFHINNINSFDDKQTGLGETFKYGDPLMDSLILLKKDLIEKHSNLKLIETYTYWRMYIKNSLLEKHLDRESCEVTISLNIGSDKVWPLFIDDEEIIIKPGDGVLYFGAKLPHWRNEYDGDYACQVFLHYVLENGKYTDFKYDKRPYLGRQK